MASIAVVQQGHSALAAVTTTRQRFFDKSSFRSSSLPMLRSQRLSQALAAGDLSLAPRRASGSARSDLEEILTGENHPEVKETLEFYIHEIRSSDPSDPNATLKVASLPKDTVPLQWGSSFVFDNEVREGLGKDSKLLGRERGWGVVTDMKSEEALQLMSKITFGEGSKYNGSTITFSGNVGGKKTPYELIILGGTGHFRGAHGYVLADNSPNDGARFLFHWKVFISRY